ncbi:MFS transporter [Actinomadura madurae]|uniref:MFS transporter n=1 Tax=Actinomadura madurae TaxID=1993 RepID=UPI0020D24816|nr:MFS transporter [Actinomadura madurae]MCQ0017490.1 MFS transporter [Actinomadura madurae]
MITGGLVVLAGGRVLRALTVATTLAWMGFGGVAVTAVLLAEHIGGPPSAGGRLLVAMAVGSLIGSLASSRWLTPKHAEPVMIAGLVAFGASLAALAVTPSLPWATAAFVAAGVSEGPVFAATLMLRQRESPPDRLGQVNTTGGSLKIGASALGAALTAAFADAVGPIGLVLGIAAFQFAGALAGLLLLRVPASEKPAEDDP